MKLPSPIFRDAGKNLQIDTCKPQIEAIAERKIIFHGLSHGAYPGERLKASELPGLSSIGHWTMPKAQDWGLDLHRNEGLELCWVESGGCAFEVDGVRHALGPDALTLTQPWQLHRLGTPHLDAHRLHWLILDVGVRRPNQDWRWPAWIVLSPEDRKDLSARLRAGLPPVLRATPDLRENFRRLAHAVEHAGAPGSVSRLAVQINDLLWNLLALLRQGAASHGPAAHVAVAEDLNARTVRLFWEDLAKHPDHLEESRTIHGMAAECGLGATAFTAHTRALLGATPMNLLLERRLDHAAALLRGTARAVTDIALSCGFSSSQYFATAFGRKFGSTPGAWREQAK